MTCSGLCKFPSTSAPTRNAPSKFARMVALSEHNTYRDRDRDPDYSYDWEREEPEVFVTRETPRAAPEPDLTERDRCGAITKPERFFKFEYSNLFSVIIGFKVRPSSRKRKTSNFVLLITYFLFQIGFVTALLLLRGCNGGVRSQPLPTTESATNERLLQRPRGERQNSAPEVAACEPEDERPETPPPAYHELRFNGRRALSQ